MNSEIIWFHENEIIDDINIGAWGFCEKKNKESAILFSYQLNLSVPQIENLSHLLEEDLKSLFNQPIYVFIVENEENLKSILSVKYVFKGKDAILEMLFNSNSLDLITNGNLKKYPATVNKINFFINRLLEMGESPENYYIDSTACMGLYGIRPMGDLDFLSNVNFPMQLELKNIIENNEKYLHYHSVIKEKLFNDSKYYLLYKGVKIITLNELTIWKLNKGTKKDLEDVRLINGFINKNMINKIYRVFVLTKRNVKIILYNIYKYFKNIAMF